MILYLDSSALVKQYLQESGSAEVKASMAGAAVVVSSVSTLVEVAATIARARRAGRMGPAAAEQALEELRFDWVRFIAIAVDARLAERAVSVTWEHALRGYDAVHLAAALSAQEDLGEPLVLATFDRELSDAAHQASLATLPDDLPAWRASPTG